MIRILRYAILSFIAAVASAQVADNNFNAFKDVVPSAQINISNLLIHASHYRTVEIDLNKLRNKLIGVPYRNNSSSNSSTIISLPLPDGSMHSYRVLQNNTMHPDLAAQFPAIKSYDGYGLGKSKEFVKFDITPLGFHAMILSPGKSPIFIDPLNKDNPKYLMVYFRRDYITHKTMNTNANDVVYGLNYLKNSASYNDFSSCYLRHYRLALAATAEYTHYFGGTVGQALAAQVITMNRVNGVYEAEIAVTMQIISNNNALIYTNPTSQPYTSGNATAMIGQNQINIDEVIGTNNYDVGHVFDQNIQNSGLASLGSVCDPLTKAQGVTGSKAPVGDPFDIDFVSHEMGHQFGANHTQNNNCNRHDPTAVEPGSGSTIMGYAGICSPNVQPLSNAYFHGINLEEIGAFINGAGGICARRKTIGTAPVVGLPNNIHIPASTPFILTASASGPGHKSYTYGWEQMNNAVSTQPPSTYSIDGPNFRSITPTLNNTRFFPKLTNLVHNGPYTWEVLSAVSRIMDFRITVRRNQPGGSCNAYQDTRVLIDGNSGPFHLTYPKNQGLHLTGLSLQNVTWTVANTNLPPVNAATVDLLLSTDGGLTYPITIVQNIPNNGSAPIFIPNVDTSTARIMIRSSNKTFFAISAYNFSITSIIPQPIIAPKLSGAVRNPLNKNNVFIYYTNLGNVAPYDHYILNGVKATSIRLDKGKGYFVVTQINTPRSVKNVTLTILRPAQPNVKTNSITIPGIL